MFLPTSRHVTDQLKPNKHSKPGEQPFMPIQAPLGPKQQEQVTTVFQTLLRLFNYDGGINYLIGLEPIPLHFTKALELPTELMVGEAIVKVSPSVSVYNTTRSGQSPNSAA